MLQTFLGLGLILVPILFNWAFASLAKQFEYPDILRQSTSVVLAKFRTGGSRLIFTWWAFSMSALAFGIIAALVPYSFPIPDWQRTLTSVLGILASLVQFLGLVRWPFMVPHLARQAEHANASKMDSIDLIFQSLNRYLGVAVGEHLGYLFTGLWTIALSFMVFDYSTMGLAVGLVGIAIGVLLVVCSLEFVGSNELNGWQLAGRITPFVYIAWSLWLIVLGVLFVIGLIPK